MPKSRRPEPIAITYSATYFPLRALSGLSFSDTFRTNIGLANLGEHEAIFTLALQRVPGRNVAVTRYRVSPNALVHTSVQSLFPMITKGDDFTVARRNERARHLHLRLGRSTTKRTRRTSSSRRSARRKRRKREERSDRAKSTKGKNVEAEPCFHFRCAPFSPSIVLRRQARRRLRNEQVRYSSPPWTSRSTSSASSVRRRRISSNSDRTGSWLIRHLQHVRQRQPLGIHDRERAGRAVRP